jgi:formylglycine-generating enzyme required for sulfatase activity
MAWAEEAASRCEEMKMGRARTGVVWMWVIVGLLAGDVSAQGPEMKSAGGGAATPGARRASKSTYVKIPAGSFMMGSPRVEQGRYENEQQVKVQVSRAFYLKATEVTRREWEAVHGERSVDASRVYGLSCGQRELV